jgi:hypothetical protein
MIDKIKAHYLLIRKHRLLKDSTILYIIENNLGMEVNWIAETFNSLPHFDNFVVLQEHEGILGFHTYATTKLKHDDLLREKVEFASIVFTDEIFSASEDASRCGEAIKTTFIDQLANMAEFVEQKPNGMSSRTITSIYTDQGQRIKGRKDDMQRAFSMLVWVATLHIVEDKRRLAINWERIKSLRSKRLTNEGIASKKTVIHNRNFRHLEREDGPLGKRFKDIGKGRDE